MKKILTKEQCKQKEKLTEQLESTYKRLLTEVRKQNVILEQNTELRRAALAYEKAVDACNAFCVEIVEKIETKFNRQPLSWKNSNDAFKLLKWRDLWQCKIVQKYGCHLIEEPEDQIAEFTSLPEGLDKWPT